MTRIAIVAATVLWLALILFSCTSVAGVWADALFQAITGRLTAVLHPGTLLYDVVEFTAEKSIHAVAFFVLALLLWRLLPAMKRKFATVLVIGTGIGICSEVFQSVFPNRDPAVRDALINCAFTAVGALIASMFDRRSRNERQFTATSSAGSEAAPSTKL